MAKINELTTRSRIALRWNNGIDYVQGRKSLDSCAPDLISTPRLVLEHIEKLNRNHGGACYALSLVQVATGEKVTKDDLRMVVIEAENRR